MRVDYFQCFSCYSLLMVMILVSNLATKAHTNLIPTTNWHDRTPRLIKTLKGAHFKRCHLSVERRNVFVVSVYVGQNDQAWKILVCESVVWIERIGLIYQKSRIQVIWGDGKRFYFWYRQVGCFRYGVFAMVELDVADLWYLEYLIWASVRPMWY